MDAAEAEIRIIRSEVEQAADAMISAATLGLGLVTKARDGDAAALDSIEATFCAILEACAFQDLTGQRLSRLTSLGLGVTGDRDPLLAGPANPGAGLNQALADSILQKAGAGL